MQVGGVDGADGQGVSIAALPGPRATIPRANNYRSTWLVSSLEGIRYGGYLERYAPLLGEHREQVLSCIAGTWIPMCVARAHYEACEALGLSDTEYAAITRGAGQVRQTWNARLIASAGRAGATPWGVLQLLPNAWARTADGGAVGLSKLAENVARLEYLGCELFDIPYFRRAVRVVVYFLVSRAGKKLSVRELSSSEPDCCDYIVEWE